MGWPDRSKGFLLWKGAVAPSWFHHELLWFSDGEVRANVASGYIWETMTPRKSWSLVIDSHTLKESWIPTPCFAPGAAASAAMGRSDIAQCCNMNGREMYHLFPAELWPWEMSETCFISCTFTAANKRIVWKSPAKRQHHQILLDNVWS